LSDTIEKQVIFRNILGKVSAFSHSTWDIILKKINVNVLEMEDVLFHHNSAVMMPEAPLSKKNRGGKAEKNQLKVTGVKALALIFKEFEFDPDKRILIAGHTDTSGDAKYNFGLSELRAKNVLYLLIGKRTEWADVCYEKHRIKDYQQILKHCYSHRKWKCHLYWCDDKWGKNTRERTKTFITEYNKLNIYPDEPDIPVDTTIETINNDSKHRWPKILWKAVYDLYIQDICGVLSITKDQLENRQQNVIKFVDDKKKFVGCGESFPIDKSQKDNHRSKANRRVVILFFDKDEAPETIDCPTDVNSTHKEKDCPIWHGLHFLPLYIKPEDLYSVVYHLEFCYYNRVKEKLMDVPDGLKIQAFEINDKNKTQELNTSVDYRNKNGKGVYWVKVRFKSPLDDNTHKKLYFEFKTKDKWIYTKNKHSDPKIVTKTPNEIKVLNKTDNFAKRWKYYDLPEHWSSRNYWTRYDNDMNKGARYEKVFKDKELKPIDNKTNSTQADQPLMFSLDDIVLIKSDGSQIIKDKNHLDAPLDLHADSRITMLYLDKADKYKVKVYKPKTNETYFSNIEFKKNLITDYHSAARAIIFCSQFYHIFDKRTKKGTGFVYAKKHIIGARAALIYDKDVSGRQALKYSQTYFDKGYLGDGCGNIELHYLHACEVKDSKLVGALIIYWSGRFVVDATKGGVALDKTHFVQEGMQNAMDRMNAKDYQLEKHSGPYDIIVKTFIFYEAKKDTRGGKHKCTVSLRDDAGGSSISPESATYRSSAYQDEAKPFKQPYGTGPDDPLNTYADYDGSTTQRLVVAHEQGHASGWDDEYVYYLDGYDPATRYRQYYEGMPYVIDKINLMSNNHATRMRNFWGYVNWLTDYGKNGKPLEKMLKGTQFKITFKDLNFQLNKTKYKNIYKSAYNKKNYAITANAKCNLRLYKLGDDEFAHDITNNQVYNGILVVITYINAKFKRDPAHVIPQLTPIQKRQWLVELEKRVILMLGNKFRLNCTSDANHDFSNVFLRFMPHYIYNTAHADTHFTLEVTKDNTNTFNPTGSTIKVGSSCPASKIIRYIYGKTTGTANLAAGDLSKIKDWIEHEDQTGESYSIVAL